MSASSRVRVLFTTPILEHPPAGGPQLRIENSIKALAQVSELHILSRVPRAAIGLLGDAPYRRLSSGFYYAPSGGNRLLRLLVRLMGRRPDEPTQTAMEILRLVDRLGIDVVWFGYGNISFDLIEAVKNRRPELKVVCDTDSVWSRFVLRELPFQDDPVKREAIEREGRAKEAEERASVDLCEVTTAVSEIDAKYYRAVARDPRQVRLFANVIDAATYESRPDPPGDLRHPSLYLAGSFFAADSPMNVACRWVLDEILPRVRKEIPDCHLYVVGRGSDEYFGHLDDPAVTVKGKLPSVLPYLAHADVALVPLKFESGTRFKILEAGACGVPLVSTTLGAEGLPVIDGTHILLADDAVTFANGIVRLIRNPALGRHLARNCRELVRSDFGIPSLSRQATEILEYLAR